MCCKAPSKLLEKVRDGQLRLDRTIEVSVTNTTEKKRILKRIWPNLATLRHLLKQNNHDYRIAVSKKHPLRERRAAWRRLIRRRNKAVRLVEEMNLRNNRLQPLFERLGDIRLRMKTLQDADSRGEGARPVVRPHRSGAAPRAVLPDADHARDARHAGPPDRADRASIARQYDAAKRDPFGRQPAAGGQRSPRSIAIAA